MALPQFSRTVVRNSVAGIAAQALIKLISFAFSVLVVRHLGAEAFGQYAGVLAFGAVFVFLSDLGLSPYMVREVARRRDTPHGRAEIATLFGSILSLRVALATGTILLLAAAAWASQRPPLQFRAIVLNSLGLILYAIQGASAAILAGYERLDRTARAALANQVVFVVIGSVALWLSTGYYGLIIASLVGVAVMTWLCWRAARALGVGARAMAAGHWPKLLRASFPFGVISLALGFSYKFDVALLSLTRSDTETGYYGAAYNLIFSAVAISNVLSAALYPSLVRLASQSPHLLAPVCERMLRYLLLLSLPLAFGAAASADQLVGFLFGAEYSAAVEALRILVWVIPLMFVSEFLGYVIIVNGQEGRIVRAVLASTGVNVALNLLVVPRYGILGAACVTIVTEVALVAQYLWLLRAMVREGRWWITFLRPMLPAFVMGLAVHWLSALTLPLVALVLVGGVTYGTLALVLGGVNMGELRMLTQLRRSARVPGG